MTEKSFFRSFPKFSHLFWIICIVISIRASYYWMSDGFSLYKIQNTFPVEEQWRINTPSAKEQKTVRTICEMPFYYFAKGSQAYAFISEDKQYVLKLFKCYHLSPINWLEKIPLPHSLSEMRRDAIAKRQKKIDSTLSSYKLAATSLRAECGLVSMQILPNPQFKQLVTITDKLGRSYSINLGDYGYIIQRKADLIYPSLAGWMRNNELTKAKNAIDSIVGLVVQRSRKGIQDSDPDLHKNAGLIGQTAIFIDLGSFHSNPQVKKQEVYKQDLLKITNNLKTYLTAQSPELVGYLENEIQQSNESFWKNPSEK